MLESVSTATNLDLIGYLKEIPYARMRRGVRIPAWYLLLVAMLGNLSLCQRLRDLERFATRHYGVLTAALVRKCVGHAGIQTSATASARWM